MTMPSVRFLPEAVEDLLESQRWYRQRDPALALDFADAFAAAVERIRRDPRSFPLIHGQFRRLVLKRFPYAVYFREQGDGILVIALHGRQDPPPALAAAHRSVCRTSALARGPQRIQPQAAQLQQFVAPDVAQRR